MNKYHMRRQDRQITDENEIDEILFQGKYAVISMCRDNEPYAVTLSYGYDKTNHALYFHTGPSGLKIDFLKSNPNVCVTVLEDQGYIMNECAHAYRSVILFGNISFVEDLDEKIACMKVILNHLEENPGIFEERISKSAEGLKHTAMLKLDISEVSGKKGR
ncbi:MAG: pyridoxamine 5'-phosphate oxidase family protein [Clostridia bacterium]|nr:pyridoxamine 5'-phosphate oxidase family protein [Clostridia bacterium]